MPALRPDGGFEVRILADETWYKSWLLSSPWGGVFEFEEEVSIEPLGF